MKLISLAVAILVSTASMAFSLNQNSTQALNTALKAEHAAPNLDKNDMTMGYGGADLSRKIPGTPVSLLA